MTPIKTYIARWEGNVIKSKIVPCPEGIAFDTPNVLISLRQIGKYGLIYLEIKGNCYAIGKEAIEIFNNL